MRSTLYSLTVFLCLTASSIIPTAEAKWISVTGQAEIINNDVAQAREDAIHQAVSYATLKSGAQFTSQQTVNNGQLIDESFTLARELQSQQVELISEQIDNNVLTVNIRLDLIEPIEPTCRLGDLKAAILVPQALIKDRTQLRYGNLGLFEQNLSERLAETLTQQSNTGFPLVHANERLDIAQELVNVRGYRLPTWLGEITDSQYILLPEIIDISTEPFTSTLGLWDNDPLRTFQIRVSLFHAISGEKIWSQQYSETAEWEFKRQQTVNSNSELFWQSEYGEAIDRVLTQVSHDIDDNLNCRPLLGQIVSRQGKRIIINLGRDHGLRVGDKLQLVLQQNMPDRLDNMRAVASKSRASITIDQVSQQSATAELKGIAASLNVQLSDLAVKM
ncbi:flagellar assembly protein FlgT [Shewanella fidelis]|uniref:Flagellar assembly protein FlgT n=1 Tax=Shewanella fidelis TaxID=173509 RepID=A0AAW8NRC7_9GAMM|nr:flagellar assembly protein FlgT [Shewanella fidelis]MDR8524499.1 flagellar assembly protein FlgT [Shewanella fidelis]MDW4811975.1 flagellar assembly protein FlgT [Shewanella fidelis]MDW4817086.1 flagellar assembly protein FlgT [Shewanella fidelis]MDW4821156.1 flagellar assembly protein FlgT [Shewanella fidelis]MDW4822581.1 flagellar assembly protein FlgT [Shewanella fidelis]